MHALPRRCSILILVCSLQLGSSALAHPDHEPATTTASAAPSLELTTGPNADAVLDQRLRFLEAQLEAPKIHAQVWFWGWMSIYIGSAGAQGARLGLVDSADLDARAQRADFTLTIVRSVLALANHLLFYRLKARYGAEPMQEIEGEDRNAKLARLAAGEEALVSYAAESRRRYSWIRHALGVAVNLAGFFIIWRGYNDLRQALITTGIGLTLGELIIWSQPWQPVGALEDYRARYGGP